MFPFELKWTDEKIASLQEMYKAEKPTRDIAEFFNVSRNAVIGALHRYIIVGSKLSVRARVVVPVEQTHRRGGKVSFGKWTSKPLPEEKRINHKPVPWPPARGYCCYVIGDPKHKPKACGLKAITAQPYCVEHYIACHEPPKEKK